MFDVICVGSSTVDVFAKTEFSELVKIRGAHGSGMKEEKLLAYPVGTKILIEELKFTTGGGGTNVSVALARLGLKAAYFGCVGDDGNADLVIADLVKNHVDISLVKHKKAPTGYSIILDSIEHDRTILTYKGVNNLLTPADIPKERFRTKWMYFSAMMGKSFAVLEVLARFAIKNKIPIAFNPSAYLAQKGAGFLKEILQATRLLVLNKEEAGDIVGQSTIPEQAKKLHALGPEIVVITDGREGAYCYAEGFIYYVPGEKLKVVETTGAGDAFASSFLAGLIMGWKPEMCMALASANAEAVISSRGAKVGLLSLPKARRRVRSKIKMVTRKPLP